MSLKDYILDFDLQSELVTRNRVFFSVIDSTNRVGRLIASTCLDIGRTPPSTVIVALEQSAGKGRLGRRWESPRGGIYASLILPMHRPEHLVQLPMVVAVALCRALDRVVDAPCRLKWPNDLVVRGRKIGGILIERVDRGANGAAVAGFGVNYSAKLGDLTPGATTVMDQTSSPPSLSSLASQLLKAVENEVVCIGPLPETVARFARWSVHREGEALHCRTAATTCSGHFAGFDERGFLRLITAGGERRISAGELIEAAPQEAP